MEHAELLWSDAQDAESWCGSSPSVWVAGEAFPESCAKSSLHSGREEARRMFIHSSAFYFLFGHKNFQEQGHSENF